MKMGFTYWHEKEGLFHGFLNDDADHRTQGGDLEDRKASLRGLFGTFRSESIPGPGREAA